MNTSKVKDGSDNIINYVTRVSYSFPILQHTSIQYHEEVTSTFRTFPTALQFLKHSIAP